MSDPLYPDSLVPFKMIHSDCDTDGLLNPVRETEGQGQDIMSIRIIVFCTDFEEDPSNDIVYLLYM